MRRFIAEKSATLIETVYNASFQAIKFGTIASLVYPQLSMIMVPMLIDSGSSLTVALVVFGGGSQLVWMSVSPHRGDTLSRLLPLLLSVLLSSALVTCLLLSCTRVVNATSSSATY